MFAMNLGEATMMTTMMMMMMMIMMMMMMMMTMTEMRGTIGALTNALESCTI